MINYNIIAGVAENLAIGNKNEIPWHIGEDLKLFKRFTTGNILIMGRKTFESIGKPLPGRTTIVITRNPLFYKQKYQKVDFPQETSLFFSSTIKEAFSKAEEIKGKNPYKEVFVAGGAGIYKQTIEKAEKLIISRIPFVFEGDAFFPEFRNGKWVLDKTEVFDEFRLEIYHQK